MSDLPAKDLVFIKPNRSHAAFRRTIKLHLAQPVSARTSQSIPPCRRKESCPTVGGRLRSRSARDAPKCIEIKKKPSLCASRLDTFLKSIVLLETRKRKLRLDHFLTGDGTGKQYRIREIIGEGFFGRVFRGQQVESGTLVALKALEKIRTQSRFGRARVAAELEILRKVHHEHVVGFFEVIDTANVLYIVLEHIESDLQQHINQQGVLTERISKQFFAQILSAVEYLHSLGIAHRDIKCENILVQNGQCKLTDFGLSSFMLRKQSITLGMRGRRGSTTYLYTNCGSIHYAAPELVAGVPYDGTRTDLWACGCILYAMMCGKVPFDSDDQEKLCRLIMSIDYITPETLSAIAQNILSNLFVYRPSERIYFKHIYKHPFFT